MKIYILLAILFLNGCCRQHDWVEINRTFYYPKTDVSCEWCSMEQIKPLLYGTTIIQFKCKKHGEIKTKEYIGVLK